MTNAQRPIHRIMEPNVWFFMQNYIVCRKWAYIYRKKKHNKELCNLRNFTGLLDLCPSLSARERRLSFTSQVTSDFLIFRELDY